MSDATEWLTYAQAGERLGITAEAVRAKAIRQRWRRMPGNDGKALVQLPNGLAADNMSEPVPTRSPRVRTAVERPDIKALADSLAATREAEQRVLKELEAERARTAVHQAEAAEQRSRADRAEGAAGELRHALQRAEEAAQAARMELAGWTSGGPLQRAWRAFRERRP